MGTIIGSTSLFRLVDHIPKRVLHVEQAAEIDNQAFWVVRFIQYLIVVNGQPVIDFVNGKFRASIMEATLSLPGRLML